jgi:hypothetical protein
VYRAFAVFLPIFAAVGVVREKKDGEIVLGDDEGYEDNLLTGPGLDEKDGEEFDEV